MSVNHLLEFVKNKTSHLFALKYTQKVNCI